MMRREGGRVVLDVSEHVWQDLQAVVGFALGSAVAVNGSADSRDVAMCLRTINAIHEGDETFTPYEVREK